MKYLYFRTKILLFKFFKILDWIFKIGKSFLNFDSENTEFWEFQEPVQYSK